MKNQSPSWKWLGKPLLFLSFLCISCSISAQNTTVTGLIKDENGQPLAGATVVVKGGSVGTSTNAAGNFSIQAPVTAILVISMVGYNPMEISLNGRTTVELQLKTNQENLSNVMVIAYGNTTRKTNTGALQSISTKELQDIPVSQISQKLQGKLAGVQILQTTGRPGEGMSVRIRGQASVSAGNQPLYVVDGFPISGDISSLNPDEIENITVLKDAASTSLYGSRAAGGVVIITTKRAKSGQTNINVNAFYGIQQIPEKGLPNVMDAREFTIFQRELLAENVVAPTASTYAAYKARVDYYNGIDLNTVGKGTDWFGLLTRNAPIQSYNVSLGAGKDRFSTMAVFGFFNQDGVLINSNYKRFSARVNSEFKFTDKLKLGVNLAPVFSVTDGRLTDGGPFASGSLITSAIVASPLAPAINADGSLPVTANSPGTLSTPNWYRVATEADATTKNNRLLSSAFLEYELLKGLTLKTSLNAELGQVLYNNYVPSTSAATNQALPRASGDLTINNNQYVTWLTENTAAYKTSFGDHHIDALAGFTSQKFRSDISNVAATNFPNDQVRTLSAATTYVPTSDIQEWSLVSYLARVGYNFKGKYLLTGSIRRDGSSRFGSDNKWGNFPSVSVGWVVSDENFMAGLKAVSFLKLRSSYGVTGNNNIGNYTYYAAVNSINSGNTNNYVFNNALAAGNAVTSLANSTVGWEKTKQFDAGLDLGLFNNRVTVSYDYYTKLTDGLLFNVPVPSYTGFSNLIANIGSFKYWGHEFLISTQNLVNDLKWTTDFNISFNRNRVEQLGTANASLGGGTSRNITKVGQPIGMHWGYVFNGIYQNKADFDGSPRFQTSNIGTVKMKDVNGDGVITVDDRTIIGNPNPDFIYGITNSFGYKNFDLTIVASGSYGNDIMNTALEYTHNLDGVFNINSDLANRWKSETNPGNGLYPRTLAGTTGLFRNANSNWVTDASFLTIKNVTLGYNIPLSNKKFMRSARLYASVQQLAVFSKYKGSNPEVSTGGLDPLAQGLDQGAYPVPRTWSFGVNIGL